MRRWLAVSAACHGGILVALSFCVRTEPPRDRAIVIACEGAAEPASDVDPREPEPALPARESVADEPLEIEEGDRGAVSGPPGFEPLPRRVPLPADARPRPVRLRRPFRRAAEPAPEPPAVRDVRGATRAPAASGAHAAIPYPRRARRRGLEGVVELRILVGATGEVERAVVERSSGHDVLDEAAKSGVARWRFEPALRDGKPVAAWIRRTIRFRLAEVRGQRRSQTYREG